MLIQFQDRESDSPVVERIWRSRSEQGGSFHSLATPNWVMVVSRLRGETFLTVRGPETQASVAECPPEGEWVGIHFRPGSFMPLLPPGGISNRRDLTLPSASRRSFQLDGSAWEYPGFDNAEAFVSRLLRKGLIVTDPRVRDALRGDASPQSQRSQQRQVLRATGMTPGQIRQIRRAREATLLLQRGVPALQVAHELGYYDQPHLCRALQRFIGQTPGQLAQGETQLSLLYKTREG